MIKKILYKYLVDEKYYLPICESILKLLTKFTIPISQKKIAKILKLTKEEELKTLYHLLQMMEYNKQLVSTSSKYYALPENINLLKGVVIGHHNGFGFLRVYGKKKDMYISSKEMKKVLHGDFVLTQQLYKDGRESKEEVHIIRVLIPRNNHIIGRYLNESGIGYVIPEDRRLSFNIFVSPENINGANIGNIVVVEMTTRPLKNIKASGNIIEILDEKVSINMAIEVALRTHAIPYIWPQAVKKQVSRLSNKISISEKKNRVNLCHLPLVTIDDDDASDFDDAVYCSLQENRSWCLWVAIADVSYYVHPQTALDIEAIKRGNSVYFPSRVIPMLPEILSNGLCSLKPSVEKLCLVCEMQLSEQGQMISYKFYEAVMCSHARLTYNKVWRILRGDKKLRLYYINLIPHLEQLYHLYKTIYSSRLKRGAISFKTTEVKFIFDKKKQIKRIEKIKRNDIHKLIEECMILANMAAANFVEKNKEPSLYRIHESPSKDSIINLRTILSEFGLQLSGGMNPRTADYANIMDKVNKHLDYELLQMIILRSMKPAFYYPKNIGHFGLALKSYAHFTSPIRRYSDLLLHRSIKYILSTDQKNSDNILTPTGGYHSYANNLFSLGEICSMAERRADEAIRDVYDWLKCDFMKNQVGNVFNGIITRITDFGFFVRLKNILIDGLVHISSLNNEYYFYDNIRNRLIGELSGIEYHLGDKVKIRVEAIHMNIRKIDFKLLSILRKVKK
ncbi:Ribonuclease R [Candidatus Arsenophonus lipoptenae]|uniref:Ribonuclease R n=1 Tax=Candidatus Arsenophonus lipoptenae TaxID=634113 RepID=A0A109QEC7_9GAMM|nr:ribonuclease R [Candidatus Arsenophonus lipoptenae]AMA65161.1 Ribonuclease R [Candidatus Arsenophonus lipoptenae]